MIYKAREEAEGALVGRKERGRACQTQRSVVEGEEQRELMWTKGRAKEKRMSTIARTCEERIGNRGEKMVRYHLTQVIYHPLTQGGVRD